MVEKKEWYEKGIVLVLSCHWCGNRVGLLRRTSEQLTVSSPSVKTLLQNPSSSPCWKTFTDESIDVYPRTPIAVLTRRTPPTPSSLVDRRSTCRAEFARGERCVYISTVQEGRAAKREKERMSCCCCRSVFPRFAFWVARANG